MAAQHVHTHSCVTALQRGCICIAGLQQSLCWLQADAECVVPLPSPAVKQPQCSRTCWLQANEMARRVLADTETSEGDLAPAPKLLEIILQNCRARVDHCVAPYLQVGGTRHCF